MQHNYDQANWKDWLPITKKTYNSTIASFQSVIIWTLNFAFPEFSFVKKKIVEKNIPLDKQKTSLSYRRLKHLNTEKSSHYGN